MIESESLTSFKTPSTSVKKTSFSALSAPAIALSLIHIFKLSEIDDERVDLPYAIKEQANIQIKYEGYIKQQLNQVGQFKKLEKRKLPVDLDYSEIKGLRLEAIQKLNAIKPESIGHASRITGVSPADISVLLIYLEQIKR